MLSTACRSAAGHAPPTNQPGVVQVAPRVEDLGSGWTERRIVFGVDPLDQPAETANELVSRDLSNRSRLLAQVKVAMQEQGSVGMGYFGYGLGNLLFSQGRYDLYLSRYPNLAALEKEWSHYSNPTNQRVEPEVGDVAIWLPRPTNDHDHQLIVRSGLYLMRLECTAKQKDEELLHLARKTAERISGIANRKAPATGAPNP